MSRETASALSSFGEQGSLGSTTISCPFLVLFLSHEMGIGHVDTLLYRYTSRVEEGKYMLADRTGMVLLAHLKNFATFPFEINPLSIDTQGAKPVQVRGYMALRAIGTR